MILVRRHLLEVGVVNVVQFLDALDNIVYLVSNLLSAQRLQVSIHLSVKLIYVISDFFAFCVVSKVDHSLVESCWYVSSPRPSSDQQSVLYFLHGSVISLELLLGVIHLEEVIEVEVHVDTKHLIDHVSIDLNVELAEESLELFVV